MPEAWSFDGRDRCLFNSRPLIGPDLAHSDEETRFQAIGRTAAGRPIIVAFTWRVGPAGRLIRPVSARYMHLKEIKAHEKPFPHLRGDEEAEDFFDDTDLSTYDFSSLTPVKFEFKRKDKSISLRLPEPLLEAVRLRARRDGMPYQRFMRLAIERALQQDLKPR